MDQFVKVLGLNEIEDGQGKLVVVNEKRVAIFKYDGDIYALDDHCPHAGASLVEGFVTDGCVRCPWHAADFDLKTGAALTPPAFDPVKTYPVRINGSDIEISV